MSWRNSSNLGYKHTLFASQNGSNVFYDGQLIYLYIIGYILILLDKKSPRGRFFDKIEEDEE